VAKPTFWHCASIPGRNEVRVVNNAQLLSKGSFRSLYRTFIIKFMLLIYVCGYNCTRSNIHL
jgi:hypothetical protein